MKKQASQAKVSKAPIPCVVRSMRGLYHQGIGVIFYAI